jgi:hypothetical protein
MELLSNLLKGIKSKKQAGIKLRSLGSPVIGFSILPKESVPKSMPSHHTFHAYV